MQKIAYIIITHSEPQQVARLVSFLKNVSNEIVIHVNADSDIETFHKELPIGCKWVGNRVAVRWGTSSLLDAILAATEFALQQTDADRFVLLSQSCLPVVPVASIQQFFDTQPETEFIGLRPMKSYGIDRWRLSFNLHRNSMPSRLQKGVFGKIIRRLGITCPTLDWKQSLGDYKPAKGCLWWALTRRACEHIIRITNEDSVLREYAGSLFGPEEIIPHTILNHSDFAKNIRHHVTFEDWSRRGPSPKWLTLTDYSQIASTPHGWTDVYGKGTAIFARKFSPEVAEKCLSKELA